MSWVPLVTLHPCALIPYALSHEEEDFRGFSDSITLETFQGNLPTFVFLASPLPALMKRGTRDPFGQQQGKLGIGTGFFWAVGHEIMLLLTERVSLHLNFIYPGKWVWLQWNISRGRHCCAQMGCHHCMRGKGLPAGRIQW